MSAKWYDSADSWYPDYILYNYIWLYCIINENKSGSLYILLKIIYSSSKPPERHHKIPLQRQQKDLKMDFLLIPSPRRILTSKTKPPIRSTAKLEVEIHEILLSGIINCFDTLIRNKYRHGPILFQSISKEGSYSKRYNYIRLVL